MLPDVLLVSGRAGAIQPELAAAGVAVVVALRWRNPWLPFIAGMAVLLGLQHGAWASADSWQATATSRFRRLMADQQCRTTIRDTIAGRLTTAPSSALGKPSPPRPRSHDATGRTHLQRL